MRFAAAFAWLRAPPSSSTMRSAGFSLLAAGLLTGLVGIAAVLFAQGVEGEWNMQRYVYREVAGAALGLALPMFLAGATMSLPLKLAAKWATGVGAAFCLGGLAMFVWLYPYWWNIPGQDYSPWGVVPYGIGLGWLAAALTSGLLAAYVEARTRREESEDADISEEEIMRDLEWASKKRLSWGGMHTDDRTLELSPTALPRGIVSGRVGIESTLVDDALPADVGTLLAFRGAKGTASEEYDLTPVDALARLREQQRMKPPTLLERLLGWWRRVTASRS